MRGFIVEKLSCSLCCGCRVFSRSSSVCVYRLDAVKARRGRFLALAVVVEKHVGKKTIVISYERFFFVGIIYYIYLCTPIESPHSLHSFSEHYIKSAEVNKCTSKHCAHADDEMYN